MNDTRIKINRFEKFNHTDRIMVYDRNHHRFIMDHPDLDLTQSYHNVSDDIWAAVFPNRFLKYFHLHRFFIDAFFFLSFLLFFHASVSIFTALSFASFRPWLCLVMILPLIFLSCLFHECCHAVTASSLGEDIVEMGFKKRGGHFRYYTIILWNHGDRSSKARSYFAGMAGNFFLGGISYPVFKYIDVTTGFLLLILNFGLMLINAVPNRSAKNDGYKLLQLFKTQQ